MPSLLNIKVNLADSSDDDSYADISVLKLSLIKCYFSCSKRKNYQFKIHVA